MKLVIDLDAVLYNRIFVNSQADPYDMVRVSIAIKNGTLLPKGHGRLGDLDFVAKRIKIKSPIGEIGKVTLEECYQEILQADTIIEADGSDKE